MKAIVRPVVPEDADVIFVLLHEFAAFDGRPERVRTSIESLRSLIEAREPPIRFVVAEVERAAVGFASFFQTWSTAAGEAGLCLEDLYVRKAWRRLGVGRSLLQYVARAGVEGKCGRIEWAVGAENQAGIAFYASIGAPLRENTRLCRLSAAAMRSLAAKGIDK